MNRQEKQLRCVHYLNQFFGQAGGEEKANMSLQMIEGSVGAGAVFQKALKDEGTVVATIVSGDNYFIEEQEKALLEFNRILDEIKPDLVIAGPAFGAGRYGLACAEVCKAAQQKGIAAVTAMFPENPGVLEHRREIYIFPTRERSIDMTSAIEKMVSFGKKLVRGTPIGTADEEGYLPRGIRKPGTASEPGSKRAVDMLAMKIRGEPFKTEIPVILPEQVKPAPPIRDISKAQIALVTTCGLIRKGNPDGQVSGRSERYFRHSIEGLDELRSTEWEAFHSGYYNKIASEDPNYILPLRQMRLLESEKFIGKIHPWIFTVAGTGTPVTNSKRMGQQMAQELVDGGVDAVLMTSA